jgi:hypothetical protein
MLRCEWEIVKEAKVVVVVAVVMGAWVRGCVGEWR